MKLSPVLSLIAQADKEQLEVLDLSGMNLLYLPPEVADLRNLKQLILGNWGNGKIMPDGNKLMGFPEKIYQLQQLEELSLSYNQICILPESISQLNNLKSFKINSNKLDFLPESIGNLTKLTSLDISSNKIKSLPELICQLGKDSGLRRNKGQTRWID
jgi:Leucine-rich repeat (LRR) protein